MRRYPTSAGPPRGGSHVPASNAPSHQKVESVKAPMPSRMAPWSAGSARCDACRDTLLSADSARLPCRHRFHQRCVADAFTKQITENSDGLKCPICREAVPIEANDTLLKSCLDPGAYYKLHSFRAPPRVVPPGKPSRSPDMSKATTNDNSNLRQKFDRGWRPCPKHCGYLGNFPKSGHPESIKCLCGYEYCSGCGVDEHVIAAHDGRWHRPSCPYFEKYSAFKGSPHASSQCPQCTQLHRCCPFPKSDGYPDKLMRSLLTGPRPEMEHPPRPAPWARG
ncbi:hypothetical protein FOL47_007133 [Perkinsus chesapeaki]|uniref:RING-type domain-containing protein n=1 Tax=Perkinsus chesapeaki TaxID=330153 RepID=A0A7J6MYD2_PERCH|nr:hypothetical protein FOL47_007133 [Perkinsus chesapeaki]